MNQLVNDKDFNFCFDLVIRNKHMSDDDLVELIRQTLNVDKKIAESFYDSVLIEINERLTR